MDIITSPDQIGVTAEEQKGAEDQRLCATNWERYEYGRTRGHEDYCAVARRNERFYLGGGLQWDPDVKKALEDSGRLATEINEVTPAINTATGYQIQNRVEFTFLPKGGDATAELAKVRSMVAKHIMDTNQYKWLETDLYEDGLIQQRGYFDIRLSFNDSLAAEAKISVLDPTCVIPDPDAKSYDPADWRDVIITFWETLDYIEQNYGLKARAAVEARQPSDNDWGDETQDEGRNKFGMATKSGATFNAWAKDTGGAEVRVRIIDRQQWRYVQSEVAIYPNGDVRIIEELTPEQKAQVVASGATITRRKMKRVRWTVTTHDIVLFDDWSPFNRFTIVPYFPYFRRGQTRGMIDNAISPQETLNKAMSSYLHIINSVANSGWVYWENTVSNMSAEQFRDNGAQTGLAIEIKANTPSDKIPRKIEPNQVPPGFDKVIEHSRQNLKAVLVNDELQGKAGEDMSGIAIQSRQFAAQMSLAKPLDSLARTRHMVAMFIDEIISRFYDDPRVLRISQTDPRTGKPTQVEVPINQESETGISNDLTVGEYSVAVAEVPISVTFENGQFQQALEMEKVRPGIIPSSYLIKASTLSDKAEIIEAIDSQKDPKADAEAALIKAQADKTAAEATVKNVEAIFSATEAAQNIAALPEVAPLADDILGSAGYIDKDGAPLVPAIDDLPPGMIPEPARNTNPLTPINPASPAVGMKAGIEGGLP